MEPVIHAKQVSVHVPGKQLLNDISFEVAEGELLVILGANGAGKSTLMKVLSGEIKASEGTILFRGKALNRHRPAELSRQRAVLTQQNAVNLGFSTRELIMMGRYPHFDNQPSAIDKDIVTSVLHATGIAHLAENDYMQLSGGEQQRVQLARILAQVWDQPGALLLLDEPVTSLDMLFQQQVMAIAKSLTERKFAVITVLHDLNLAVNYADRIIMLRDGKIYCDGSVTDVITPGNIYDVFGIEADILTHPESLFPFIVPKRTTNFVQI